MSLVPGPGTSRLHASILDNGAHFLPDLPELVTVYGTGDTPKQGGWGHMRKELIANPLHYIDVVAGVNEAGRVANGVDRRRFPRLPG